MKPLIHIDPSDPSTVHMEIRPDKQSKRKDPREWICDYCGAVCRDKVCECGEVRPK